MVLEDKVVCINIILREQGDGTRFAGGVISLDPVAADAMATTLFGLVPEDISSIVAAHRMGLGQMDLTRMNLLSGSV